MISSRDRDKGLDVLRLLRLAVLAGCVLGALGGTAAVYGLALLWHFLGL